MTSISSQKLNGSTLHLYASRYLPLKQSGFSLLELLISLLIFAIGFLGLASLQHVSIKMTHDSVLQNSAIILSSSLTEQIRATGGSVDLTDWQERVKKELPQGKATLSDQGGQYQLNMQWQESQHSDDASKLQSYQTFFKINP